MLTLQHFGPVLVVEFSTGWGVFCSETQRVLATVYDELETVVDLCNGEGWLVSEFRKW